MRFPFFGRRRNQPVQLSLPPFISTRFGVFFRQDKPTSPEALLAIVHEWLPDRAVGELRNGIVEFTGDARLTDIAVRHMSELPCPSIEFLRYTGLSELEERRMEAATHVVLVETTDILAFPRFGLISALAVARALAFHLNGVIFDVDCGRILSMETYDDPLPEHPWLPVATQVIMPYSVDRRGNGWMTTVGMSKYGLPNLEIRNIPPNIAPSLAPLMGGVIHRLVFEILQANQNGPAPSFEIGPEMTVDRRHVDAAFGDDGEEAEEDIRGWTIVRLGYYPPRRGQEKFLGVMPPRDLARKTGVWLYQACTDLAPAVDTIGAVRKGSEAMEIASRRAIGELPDVRNRFAQGLPVGATLFVKHGFQMPSGDKEFMWIAVKTWHGDRIHGILANSPAFIPNLQAGEIVAVKEADISDWMISHQDGHTEGAYTTKVVMDEGHLR